MHPSHIYPIPHITHNVVICIKKTVANDKSQNSPRNSNHSSSHRRRYQEKEEQYSSRYENQTHEESIRKHARISFIA